jgi:hypothetical protein
MRTAIAAFLAAVAGGIGWMLTAGAPPMFAAVNLVAALLALAIAAVLYRKPSQKLELVVLWLAPVAMAASIAIGPDVDGVHRWIAIGPLRLHAAALFCGCDCHGRAGRASTRHERGAGPCLRDRPRLDLRVPLGPTDCLHGIRSSARLHRNQA